MKNIVGNAKCDTFIVDELDAAHIEYDRLAEPTTREVPSAIVGKLGPFTLWRAWYYWVVKEPMPLAVARVMYEHPIGRRNVRADGDGDRRPPDKWAQHYDADGVKLESDLDGSKAAQTAALCETMPHLRPLVTWRYVPDAAAVAERSFVECYHIDSAEGLRMFADTVRLAWLAPPHPAQMAYRMAVQDACL
jgi:hypothetical protein